MAPFTPRKRKSQDATPNDSQAPRKRRNTSPTPPSRLRLRKLVNWITFPPRAGGTRQASFLDQDFGDEVKEGLAYLVSLVAAAAERNDVLKEEVQHWQDVRAEEEEKLQLQLQLQLQQQQQQQQQEQRQRQQRIPALPPTTPEEQHLDDDIRAPATPPSSSPPDLHPSHESDSQPSSPPPLTPSDPGSPAHPPRSDEPDPPQRTDPEPLILRGGLPELHALLHLEYQRGYDDGFDEGLAAGRAYGEEEGFTAGVATAQAAGAVVSLRRIPAGGGGVKVLSNGAVVTANGVEEEEEGVMGVRDLRAMGVSEFMAWVAGLSGTEVKGEIWRLMGVRERIGAENEGLAELVRALRPSMVVRLKVGRENMLRAIGRNSLLVKLKVRPRDLVRIVEGEYGGQWDE
ncbi:hypothetical protein W97_01956 [Coniosporium apollinis CBS 100218]|uniref:Uncharacterized protein n=1 Tax=Coniosporium apollinis (strain CBS 100218) TaxID=1168221 RepID=R7YM70_CONA1|nr:uncharacterized protein W97_01956 [Coniosporium apollinis CBS 100218]EON62731.1 hypothetical protein W97_01956 [Coniosporium apollinis CBS 100218]